MLPLALLAALLLLLGAAAAAARRRVVGAGAARQADAAGAGVARRAARGAAAAAAGADAAGAADAAAYAADAAFARRYPGYGYGGGLAAVAADFAHLPRDEVYLDHAGSTLCAAAQARRHADAVLASTLGNPHSRNPAGQRAAQVVRRARELVLRHFEASERDYAVVFTSGCTGAVQTVAQNFRWTPGQSVLGYALCNHNSVLGMREAAKQHGCPFVCVPPPVLSGLLRPGVTRESEGPCGDVASSGAGSGDEGDDGLATPRTDGWESTASDCEDHAPAHLFVFSPECNFSVRQHAREGEGGSTPGRERTCVCVRARACTAGARCLRSMPATSIILSAPRSGRQDGLGPRLPGAARPPRQAPQRPARSRRGSRGPPPRCRGGRRAVVRLGRRGQGRGDKQAQPQRRASPRLRRGFVLQDDGHAHGARGAADPPRLGVAA